MNVTVDQFLTGKAHWERTSLFTKTKKQHATFVKKSSKVRDVRTFIVGRSTVNKRKEVSFHTFRYRDFETCKLFINFTVRVLHIQGPFICDKCGSKLSSRGSLSNHNSAYHRTPTMFCDWCPRLFNHKYRLVEHMGKNHKQRCFVHSIYPEFNKSWTNEIIDNEFRKPIFELIKNCV